MKKAAFIILAVILASCASQSTIPAFRQTLYIDYNKLRSLGIEVTDDKPGDNTVTLGAYQETVCYGRKTGSQFGDGKTGIPMGRRLTINEGSYEEDIEQLHRSIANSVKERGGDGIAYFRVVQTTISAVSSGPIAVAPVFTISGTIYKNK